MLRRSKTTQDGDSKLLLFCDRPFQIVSRVQKNSFKVRVDVSWKLEVIGNGLKPEIQSPKGRVKPLFWTSKWLSERRIEGANYKADEGDWRFLVKYKGFPESENSWEPPSSFVHGYATGFSSYLRAHPEIHVLFTDCLSKNDRVVEKGRNKSRRGGRTSRSSAIDSSTLGNRKQDAPLKNVHMRATIGVRCVNEDSQTGSVVAASLQRWRRWLFVHIQRHSELIF